MILDSAGMIYLTYDKLNKLFQQGPRPRLIGTVAIAQNPGLRDLLNQAVGPYSGFIFVGYDARGFPMRVKYFDDARLHPARL